MKSVLLVVIFVITSFFSTLLGLPYQVDQELLEELNTQLTLYEVQPSSNERVFELSMTYAYTGQIDKGWDLLKTLPRSYSQDVINKYSRLIENNPNQWKYHFKLAFGFYFNKQVDAAIKQFEKVIEMNPDNIWPYGFIALIYNEMDNPKESIAYCKQAIELEPNATAIYALQGIAYLKQRRLFKAYRSYRKFKRLYAKH